MDRADASVRAGVPRACSRPREVELLSFSASYEGIPEEVGPDHFFPVTWNPMNMIDWFAETPGVLDARRIGFDGLSPFFEGLLRTCSPTPSSSASRT